MGLVTLPKNAKPKEVPIPDLAPPDTECVAHVILQNCTIQNPNFHNAIVSVTVRCGAQISENCTYFESSGSEIGQCGVKICKCDANICQVIFPIRVFTRNCQDIFYTMGQNLTIHKKFLCLKNVNFEEDANETFFKM